MCQGPLPEERLTFEETNKRHELSRIAIKAVRDYIDMCVEERLNKEKTKTLTVPEHEIVKIRDMKPGEIIKVPSGHLEKFWKGEYKSYKIQRVDGKLKLVLEL